MKKVMDIFDRVLELLAYLAGGLFAFMMVAIVIDVALRFFFGRPLGWVVQFSGYSLLYITFLATAWLLKREGHVAIDIVFHRLNPKNQFHFNVITSITGIIACLVLTWYGGLTTLDSFERGIVTVGNLRWPEGVLLAIIPVGSFLLTIQFIRRTYGYLKQDRKKGS